MKKQKVRALLQIVFLDLNNLRQPESKQFQEFEKHICSLVGIPKK